ncbi:ABC transporter substrate-binding protein [Lederbergia citrea]|uniref:ABC transporter substrate-binding protein n=1 Tax=Lederbergia citrea TaxID=2833581 RepID=UPI001BC91B2D|nr:sugar ABC transporter substrate-binding protein [Lederbergia citrea]MBS4178241.1 sugar ABC transporter substrate-binding protein [Lederbergia citrea]
MKRPKQKFLFISMILLLLVGLMSGCNTNKANQESDAEAKDGKINLRIAWWGSQDRHDKTQAAIKLFEEKNPDIKVTAEFTGWDGYWEKLATAAAGKNLPDVIQMDYARMVEYVDRDLLLDLAPYVDSGVINLDDVGDSYINGGYYNDKLVAVNIGTNSPAIAYDPAMFEEAGVDPSALDPGYTWEDYIDISKKLKEGLGDNKYGIGGVYTGLLYFNYYLRQHGKQLYNEDGTGLGYDDDQLAIDYYTYWNNLLEDGIAAPPKITTTIKGLEDELIVQEKAPTIWFHSNQVVALQESAGRDLKLALFPTLPGGEEGLYLKPGQFFSVSTQAKQPEAAAKWIDFVTNDLEANEILAAERGVPISSKVRDHLKPLLGHAAQAMFEYIELVEKHSSDLYPPEPVGAGEITALIDRITEELNYGRITPEEAAKKFRAEATTILAKNK